MFDSKRITSLVLSIFCAVVGIFSIKANCYLLRYLNGFDVYGYIAIVAIILIVTLICICAYVELPSILKNTLYIIVVLLAIYTMAVVGSILSFILAIATIYFLLTRYTGTKFFYKVCSWGTLISALFSSIFFTIIFTSFNATFNYLIYHNYIVTLLALANAIIMYALKEKIGGKTEEEKAIYDEILEDINNDKPVLDESSATIDESLDDIIIDEDILNEVEQDIIEEEKEAEDLVDLDEDIEINEEDLLKDLIDDEEEKEIKEEKVEEKPRKTTKKTTKK